MVKHQHEIRDSIRAAPFARTRKVHPRRKHGTAEKQRMKAIQREALVMELVE